MDYCSACRRHLNGALVCPGCGVCASPDLAPMPVRASAYAVRQPGDEDVPAPRPGRSVPPPAAPHRPAEVPSGSGRAARRREQSRWRKTRRRTALVTAVALVGGGLTLAAALNHQPADRTRPTAAQGERPMGGTGPEATAGLPVPTASPAGRPAAASTPPRTSAKPPAAPRSATPIPHKATPKAAKPSPPAHPRSHPLLPLPHDPAPASTTPLTPPRRSPTPAKPTPTKPTPTKPTPATDATTPTPTERTGPPAVTPSAPQSPAPTESPSPTAAPSTSPSHVCLLVLCLG
ncbi:SCO2400 family protein [Streptomyces griseoluteus]